MAGISKSANPACRSLLRSSAIQLEADCPDDQSLLLFHSKSGDTHCLNLVDATAFRNLPADVPIGFDPWVQKIANELAIDVDDELIAYLQELIHQFHELGIAHCLSA